MTIAIDTVNCAANALPSVVAGGTNTVSGTCSGVDNCLMALEFNRQSGSGTQAPTSVTYNGIALTQKITVTDGSHLEGSMWTLANPPTGTSYPLVATYANACAAAYLGLVPVSGANNTFGTFLSATSGANNNPAVTPVGGGTNDLYLSFAGNNDTTQTNGGSQTNLASGNDISKSSINSLCCVTGATLPGTGSGAFTWTGTGTPAGTSWVALGVAMIAAPPTVQCSTGTYFEVGQAVNFFSTGSSNYLFLGAPGLFNLDLAVVGGVSLALALGQGSYLINGETVAFTTSGAPTSTPKAITKSGGRVVLPTKKQGEAVTYGFDFISSLVPGETILSAIVRAGVWSGTDPAPGNLTLNPSTITGTKVSQLVIGGLVGVIYFVTCAATTSLAQVIELSGYIAVVPDIP